jgi:hypothetical protein
VRKNTRQVSQVLTRPSPVKGINAYDGIGSMPEGFALVLRNLFAQPYGCQVRRGYVRHASLIGEVETVASHNKGADPKLYAWSYENTGSSLYDVTAPNTNNPAPKLTGLSNARWQFINFPNITGVSLVAVNGADDMIWIKPDNTIVQVAAGDGTGNTIKGIDPKKLIHVYSHQKRLWFVEKDSTAGWYLPPDQITGDATLFDFGPNWTRGGYLNQIITWTIDDGNGADDHLAAISSEGEVSIYQGIDPNAPETWALQGVYYAGAPVGRRSACRYGGDIALLTQHGLVFLSNLLKSTKVNPTEEGSGKYVQQLISGAVSETGDKFGWEPFVFPGANMLIINIPATDTTAFQFVMNDITKAWSEFIGYQANSWDLHQQLPVYGSFGAVYRAWEGHLDGSILDANGRVETPGSDVRFEAQTSFSLFNNQVVNKHFKMVRPSFLSAGAFSLSIAANVDYSFQSPAYPIQFAPYRPGRWDEDAWDSARWAGGLIAYNEWTTVLGIGFAASLRILGFSSSETYWATTDWLFEPGGVM